MVILPESNISPLKINGLGFRLFSGAFAASLLLESVPPNSQDDLPIHNSTLFIENRDHSITPFGAGSNLMQIYLW